MAAFVILQTTSSAQTVSTIAGPFPASGGVTVADSGIVFIGNYGDELQNSNGTQAWRFTHQDSLSVYANAFQGASGNCVDAQGNFYQSNIAGGFISKVTPGGVVSVYSSNGIVAPVGVVADADGFLYVGNCGDNTIRKIPPGGGTATLLSSDPLLSCPNGIAIDDDNNIYASNFNNGNVIKVEPDGTTSWFASIAGNRNGHIAYRNGYLFVASHGSNRIWVVGASQNPILLAGSGVRGNADGPATLASFSLPNGIDVSVTGDTVYVNTALPTQVDPNYTLNPTLLRMITGVNATIQALSIEPLTSAETLLVTVKPNPVETSSVIEVKSVKGGILQGEIIDLQGRIVATLPKASVGPSQVHTWAWPDNLRAGIYMVEIQNGAQRRTQKVVIPQH